MSRTEILNAHAAKLNADYEALCVGGGMTTRAFWENICSQYTNGVIKRFLTLRGVKPAATMPRLCAQVEAL